MRVLRVASVVVLAAAFLYAHLVIAFQVSTALGFLIVMVLLTVALAGETIEEPFSELLFVVGLPLGIWGLLVVFQILVDY